MGEPVSRTVLAEVKGFTPLIDVIVDDLGLITAAVFGRVWRYCEMKSGTCTASVETIATELSLSICTVRRHLRALCEAGYLEDETPDRRNAPHVYSDTGKAQLMASITALSEGETEVYQKDQPGLSERPTEVYQKDQPRSIRKTTEDRSLRENKETGKKESRPDYLDLVLKTEQAQKRLKYPIEHLSGIVVGLLSLKKVPGYKHQENWADPLADLLDQADGDVGVVEQALRSAHQKGIAGGLTMASPKSLHALALEALSNSGGQKEGASLSRIPEL